MRLAGRLRTVNCLGAMQHMVVRLQIKQQTTTSTFDGIRDKPTSKRANLAEILKCCLANC